MKNIDKNQFRRYCGDLSGIYGTRRIILDDGKARGMRAVELWNGRGLQMMAAVDRALDIPFLYFKGINIGLNNKTGLCEPRFYSEDGTRGFLRQFNGGLLTTCGIVYSGASSMIAGVGHGLHGNIANTPAELIAAGEQDNAGNIELFVSGEVREACTFNEYMVLNRKIVMETEKNKIHIHDEVENRGFNEQPVMNLYHINIGYPMLDESVQAFSTAPKVYAGGAISAELAKKWNEHSEPLIQATEHAFIHVAMDGKHFGMFYNTNLQIAVVVSYDATQLPYLCQWKNMLEGDYAAAFEPSISGYYGLARIREKGLLRELEPGGTIDFDIDIEVIDDKNVIDERIAACVEKTCEYLEIYI